MDNSFIFNITEIPSNNGQALTLEFYGGDITSRYSDILLVSAFQGDFNPTKRTVLGRIHERFDISFQNGLPDNAIKLRQGIYDLSSPKTEAYKCLWVLEMTNRKEAGEEQNSNFYASMKRLEKLIDVIEYLELESISIPLLGSGAQNLSLDETATGIMSVVRKWAMRCDSLKTVRVFAYDLKAASKLNHTIDAFFGQDTAPSSTTSLELLRTCQQELEGKIGGFSETLLPHIEEINNLLNTPTPSVKSIAVAGRVLAEICSECLINIWSPDIDTTTLSLNEMLSMLHTKILEDAGWMLSYFRLLQSSGNTGAHHSRHTLTVIDAVAIVLATLRVAEYTTMQINRYLIRRN
ncbi:hypothetical protein K5X82_00820 [Halosquirtibacter xylanolyticus]|uniref:hypothetical protein n=1 Tax=Halosquirtibacter xylanolyticus TaxID=3374599 RepID=UPI003749DF8B|nr:hypothetical protein K5X82_00820 [Prolixibacteraceae bacterium]